VDLLSVSSVPAVLAFLLIMLSIGIGYTRRASRAGLLLLWAGVLGMLVLILAQILRALPG
jgi:lipopolysaccharide export LptBFGC system permease protein LptF